MTAGGVPINPDMSNHFKIDYDPNQLRRQGWQERRYLMVQVAESGPLKLDQTETWPRKIRTEHRYIVGFYNWIRLHSVLDNLSSSAFERKMTAKKPVVVSEYT